VFSSPSALVRSTPAGSHISLTFTFVFTTPIMEIYATCKEERNKLFTSLVTYKFYLGNLYYLHERGKNLKILLYIWLCFKFPSVSKRRKILLKFIRDFATEAA
jgi:hypothetical protein